MLVISVTAKRPPIRARGSLLAGVAHIVGVGAVAWAGSGALSGTSHISGAGVTSSRGSGALAAQASHIVGTGNSGDLVSGSGALHPGNSALSGAGISKSTGTGALVDQASTITGSGGTASITSQFLPADGESMLIDDVSGAGTTFANAALLNN